MKILVVKQEDGYLPKGYISSMIQDHEDFSEYEKTCGFWEVVTDIDSDYIKGNTGDKNIPYPLPHPEPDPEHPGFYKRQVRIPRGGEDFTGDKFIPWYNFQSGKVVMRPRSSLLNKPQNFTPFDHPSRAGLDRSHSTIWDYGPGRTYSSPQAAFDALLSLVGSADFTEAHYIRGWTGTYTANAGLYFAYEVLNIRTVRPTRDYRLFIDVEDGETVTWDALFSSHPTDYCSCLVVGNGISAETMSHVIVKDMVWKNAAILFFSGTKVGTHHQDWLIDHIDASAGDSIAGFGINGMEQILFVNNFLYLPSLSSGIGVFADSTDEDAGEFWMIENNIFIGGGTSTGAVAIAIDGKDCRPRIICCSNSFYNCYAALGSYFSTSGSSKLRIGCLHNNILGLVDRCIFIGKGTDDNLTLEIFNSDFNIFYPQSGKILDHFQAGRDISNLVEWQQYVNSDYNSFKQDPLYNDPGNNDLSLQAGSPAKGNGRMFEDPDQFGTLRTYRKVDMGAWQTTLPVIGVPVQAPRVNYPSVEEREFE